MKDRKAKQLPEATQLAGIQARPYSLSPQRLLSLAHDVVQPPSVACLFGASLLVRVCPHCLQSSGH